MNKPNRVGGKLHRIDLLMRYHLRSHEKGLIPPSQMRMLEFIELHDGCTQAEVADEMQVSPASVAQSIKRMEASGFLKRGACPDNLRANSLHITDAGVDAAKNCRLVFDELEKVMLKGFTDDEKSEFSALLLKLIGNLESGDTDSMNNMELTKLLCEGKKE